MTQPNICDTCKWFASRSREVEGIALDALIAEERKHVLQFHYGTGWKREWSNDKSS